MSQKVPPLTGSGNPHTRPLSFLCCIASDGTPFAIDALLLRAVTRFAKSIRCLMCALSPDTGLGGSSGGVQNTAVSVYHASLAQLRNASFMLRTYSPI